jgi:predicted aspartyl protease
MNKQRSTFIVKRILLFFFLLAHSYANESKNTSYGSAEQKTLAEFKITKNGGPILLPITFIDKELLFLLDTGSSHTVYDVSIKHELGKVKRIENALTFGSPIKAEVYDAPDAFLGPLNLKDSNEVFCLDLKMLSLIDGKTISGIIGMNFLKRHIIQIDFDQGTLSFLQPVEDQHPDWGIELLLKFDTPGWPYITGEILESINANFVIDTGSNSTGALGSEIFDQILSEKELKTSKTLFATASGVIQNRECRIDSFSIGSFEYKELIFSEANWSCLGLLFLSRHTVTFDFPNSRIYLKKAKDFKKMDETDMSGLHLLRIANQTVVYSVDENSPAQKAGIVPKDIILKVNEKDAGKYDMWELRRLLMSKDKRNITMAIKDGDEVKKISFLLNKKI